MRDDGSETAADGSTTTADSGTTSTVDGSSSTTDGATTTSGSTSTSGDEPTSTSDGTSTTADTPAQVLEFRGILTENGLTSTGLSDEDIATFGTRFCVFAIASESEAEYEDFRQQAIETTTSDLSDEELFTVVDAAVVVFCPDEAARLGIES